MTRTLKCLTGLACLSLLAGCGDINVRKYIPFTGDAPQERSRTPANATEYQCSAGKRFYVRTLEGGAAVWLILPEREVRLNKLGAGADMRYSNGIAVLEISGNTATLTDGAAATFTGCKTGGSEAPASAR
ncbi:MAG: MliC family protein [Sulfuritalea sp.]|jgi:membrane-bound inhibitor of C-type lysozyme|nr:MliC family protein [Sulfuritalea sp.]